MTNHPIDRIMRLVQRYADACVDAAGIDSEWASDWDIHQTRAQIRAAIPDTDALLHRIHKVRAELCAYDRDPGPAGGFAARHAARMSQVLQGLEEAAELIGLDTSTVRDANTGARCEP